MRLSIVATAALALALVGGVSSFSAPAAHGRSRVALFSTTEEAAAAPADSAEPEIPTNLPSEMGMDYVPLATMLATGQIAEADQFTRDALITIAGSKEKGREFVYFTEVKNIPSTDLATIERLWNKFSKGKFGYSVQKVRRCWDICMCEASRICIFLTTSPLISTNPICRESGDSPRVTLRFSAVRLAGLPRMEKSSVRRNGSVLLNSLMMSRRLQRDTCHLPAHFEEHRC